MSTETLAVDRIKKAFEDLEAQKSQITSCTLLWKNLDEHFSSLEKSLDERSNTLDSKIETLEAETKQTLESLDSRESSIPDRESSAATEIEEKKSSVVKELEDPEFKNPEDIPGLLRYYCRRMDHGGLWRFMISKRKDLSLIRREIPDALASSVDPCRLALDTVEDFLNRPAGTAGVGSGGERCWAVGMLLRALFDYEGRKGPEASESIRERAAVVAEAWKKKIGGKGEGEEEGEMGGAEAQIFLQLVVAFGLSSRFEGEFLRKLVIEHAVRKEMAKLAAGLGFGDKMADIIGELIKAEKELEAVHFAQESGLGEKFHPAPLFKSYLHRSRKDASAILKNGKHSAAATEESSNVELSAMRSIIKCVEYYKLEPKYNIDGLKKRLAQMEKTKADRKKAALASRSQTKRARAAGGMGTTYRPSKAVRTNVVPYPSFHRNPPGTHQMPPARSSYNYPIHGSGYDVQPAATYVGASHAWSPTAVSQQYYMQEDMGGPRNAEPYGGSSAINYGVYDYPASHTTGQPPYPH
ncbi:FRIGIDA-like protein 4a [Iris pallida]|uniref:FRIGIDA-like protein n=1 Tax=Iris pallida TaxID=29817 RepID=A0AAX6GWM8_IRIPA|nr:FRIGIDA-like protein 4a [Iris pallida]